MKIDTLKLRLKCCSSVSLTLFWLVSISKSFARNTLQMDAFERGTTHKSKTIHIHPYAIGKRETQDCICYRDKKAKQNMRSTAMQAAQSIDKNEYTRNIKHVFIRMLDVYCIYCTFPKHMLSEIHTLLLYIVDSLHTNTYRITARMSLLHAKYRRNQENCTKILVQSFGRQSALYKPFIQQRLATI